MKDNEEIKVYYRNLAFIPEEESISSVKKKYTVVTVAFDDYSNKTYDYIFNGKSCNVGDIVMIHNSEAEVKNIHYYYEDELPLLKDSYKTCKKPNPKKQ